MGKIAQKLDTINAALETLYDSIDLYEDYAQTMTPARRDTRIFVGLRDSVIQRFEYCTDLLWKVLKIYLEEVEKVTLTTNSPRGIIRETVKTKTLSEQDGHECMQMIINRNKTSHIYHEEVAEDIVDKVPSYYALMKKIVDTVQQKSRL